MMFTARFLGSIIGCTRLIGFEEDTYPDDGQAPPQRSLANNTKEKLMPATQHKTHQGVEFVINYLNENDQRVSEQELSAYIARDKEMNPGKHLKWAELDIEGEDVGITYHYDAVPFERIRRITGYLVGTLDRFNDAKRAEEHDRVKHNVPKVKHDEFGHLVVNNDPSPACCNGR